MQDAHAIHVLSSEALLPARLPEPATIPMPDANDAEIPRPQSSSDARLHPTDEQLMLALSQGSSDAFTDLFHRYKQLIYGFFRRRVFDSARAEELTQETFLALFGAAKRYEPRALFRTYLFAIAFRILRADRRKAVVRAMFLGPLSRPKEPVTRTSADDTLHVREALAKLDPADREILMLREFEQLSYSEIADLLKLPLNTVRSKIFRARLALRERLEAPQPAKSAALGEPA